MSVLAKWAATLRDHTSRMDANGKVDKIAELLHEMLEILDDIIWLEGNLPTGHKTTVRTGLPSVAWRMLNYGVKPSKSTTKQVTDECGMLEAYAVVDKSLADLNDNSSEFMLSEAKAFLEAMKQEFVKTLFYGDTNEFPAKFIGFTPRYNRTERENPEVEDTADYVIDAKGTGTNLTSIWLVVWNDNSVHCIFPKGSKAGLHQDYKGQDTLKDAEGGEYEGYRTHFKWDCGVVVRDFRQVVRICNIDTDKLATTDLVGFMVEALEKVHSLTDGKPAFYMARPLRTALRQQIRKTENVHLSIIEVAGKKVVAFDEVPVRRVDGIMTAEAKVL